MMAGAQGSPMLKECARLLIPGLIEYVAKMAPLVHEDRISEAQATSIGEVWKGFGAFFASVTEDHREQYHTVIISFY
jgi:HEAT repeat-containing protein 5